MEIPAINYHLFKPCNLRCQFCFATFRDVSGQLAFDEACRLLSVLRANGGEKLNFAGGEPTLHPRISDLIRHAKALGFVTSIVTNGARLESLVRDVDGGLDWVALSVDSANEGTQRLLGRGKGTHVAKAIRLAELCRGTGIGLKLNTVVTSLNWQEDMTEFVRRFMPSRWKVFQVLKVAGQNDGAVEPLLISKQQFVAFIARHAALRADGIEPVAEDNDAMTDSYVMIDPLGRFFGNSGGIQSYSQPILDVGVPFALAQIGYDGSRFKARGGEWAWHNKGEEAT